MKECDWCGESEPGILTPFHLDYEHARATGHYDVRVCSLCLVELREASRKYRREA
jgi:hypothetical protein